MTSPALAPEVTEPDTGSPDITHLVCECDEDRALCGTDVPGPCWVVGQAKPEQRCVVCWDLMSARCERCGQDRT